MVRCRSVSALAFSAAFAVLADRLTFYDILLFATPLALSKNLDASIINEGFSALNFQVRRGLWHRARMLASFLRPRPYSHASTIQLGWCYRGSARIAVGVLQLLTNEIEADVSVTVFESARLRT
jgi:hypothetical protein